ncbi:RNA polymerase sigma factor [Paraburkholderia sp.]|uniref:RNA polymerase sigma factor n=1 Tax=Paraburkholderia sp. TaxID=1926495 RepID=UPI0026004658|nr:RNA polymerase sigma factor [Paraburkholderia sp.]
MTEPAAWVDAPLDDDLSIARRVAAGDHTAFVRLMRRYNQRLYRLARATLRDDTEAEDALQDAYLNAWRSIAGFRGDAALSTWLSRLVINACLARMRRHARRQNVVPIVSMDTLENEEIDAVPSFESDAPDRAVARAQMRALIERKLDAMPEAFRIVFVLRSVEEMSVEEVAQCLDIPGATVRSRYFRARALLREALAQEIELVERDLFEFGGAHCDRVVANVLSRISSTDGVQGDCT